MRFFTLTAACLLPAIVFFQCLSDAEAAKNKKEKVAKAAADLYNDMEDLFDEDHDKYSREANIPVDEEETPEKKKKPSLPPFDNVFALLGEFSKFFADMTSGKALNWDLLVTLTLRAVDFFAENPGTEQLLLPVIENFGGGMLTKSNINSALDYVLSGYKYLKSKGDVHDMVSTIFGQISTDKFGDEAYMKNQLAELGTYFAGSSEAFEKYNKLTDLLVEFVMAVGEMLKELDWMTIATKGSIPKILDYIGEKFQRFAWNEVVITLEKNYKKDSLIALNKDASALIDSASDKEKERLSALERKIPSLIKNLDNVAKQVKQKLLHFDSNFEKDMDLLVSPLEEAIVEIEQISKILSESSSLSKHSSVQKKLTKLFRKLKIDLARWKLIKPSIVKMKTISGVDEWRSFQKDLITILRNSYTFKKFIKSGELFLNEGVKRGIIQLSPLS